MPHRDHDAGSFSEWQGQAMGQVEVEGKPPVLLIQDGETLHAVAATCPHAGGPLA